MHARPVHDLLITDLLISDYSAPPLTAIRFFQGLLAGRWDRGTVGSAVWADYVVDGDLAHEIDAREIPGDWPNGFMPLERVRPFELPRPAPIGEVYTLNARLVDWAYQLTKDVHLTDNEKAQGPRPTG